MGDAGPRLADRRWAFKQIRHRVAVLSAKVWDPDDRPAVVQINWLTPR
ncbi:hypothetical protein [Phenylobacterium sp.]|nr:hypothetical protein [Phenylobacterium sp.]